MKFLPFHFLLSTVSGNGLLSYHDVTNGKQIVAHRTKQGLCDTMALNPWNAVVNLGHASGLVTLWTPNMHEAVVKMQCHQGPSTFLSIPFNMCSWMLTLQYVLLSSLHGHRQQWQVSRDCWRRPKSQGRSSKRTRFVPTK